jgi:hypothetical protein
MFKHYLERIQNVETWPIISLILFVAVFVIILIYVFSISKKHIDQMKSLPFDEGELTETENKSLP